MRAKKSHTGITAALTIFIIITAIPLILSNVSNVSANPKPADINLEYFKGYDAKKGWTPGEIAVHPGDKIRFKIGLKNEGGVAADGLFVHIHYDYEDGKGVVSLVKTGGAGTYSGPFKTDKDICGKDTGDHYYNVMVGTLLPGATVELDFNATISSSASWKGASVHMGHICWKWIGEKRLHHEDDIPLKFFVPEFTAGTVAPMIGASIALCGYLLTRRLRFKVK